MFEGYVLVETRLGRAQEVAHRCEAFEEILHADLVTGCYDVVVRIRAASLEDMMEIVDRLKAQDGVTRTLLCPVSHEDAAAHRGWQPLHAAV